MNKRILQLLVVILIFSNIFIFSSCSNQYNKLEYEMLSYANEKYDTELKKIKFQKETKNELGLRYTNKLLLEDENGIEFYVSCPNNVNDEQYVFYDNYIDVLASHKIKEYLNTLDEFKELDGDFCINTIIKANAYSYQEIVNLKAEEIIQDKNIYEIDFVYNPIGENGYLAENITKLYSLYTKISSLTQLTNIDFEVIVTPKKDDELISSISSMLCPLYSASEWYELYNLYYSKANAQYQSKTVITEVLLLDELNISNMYEFYSYREDLSYDFNEYVRDLQNGIEPTTQNHELVTN